MKGATVLQFYFILNETISHISPGLLAPLGLSHIGVSSMCPDDQWRRATATGLEAGSSAKAKEKSEATGKEIWF